MVSVSAAAKPLVGPDPTYYPIVDKMGESSLQRLIAELLRQRRGGLTIIANDTAKPGLGIGLLITARLVKKIIASHIGTNPETQKQSLLWRLMLVLVFYSPLIRGGSYGCSGVSGLAERDRKA